MGRPQSFVVRLTRHQREFLEQLGHQSPTRKQRHRCSILLRADAGATDREIAEGLEIHPSTVQSTRRRFACGGLEAALVDRPRSGAPPRMNGQQRAMAIALARCDAPHGRARWSIRLLARRLVELEIVEAVSRETVRLLLKRAT